MKKHQKITFSFSPQIARNLNDKTHTGLIDAVEVSKRHLKETGIAYSVEVGEPNNRATVTIDDIHTARMLLKYCLAHPIFHQIPDPYTLSLVDEIAKMEEGVSRIPSYVLPALSGLHEATITASLDENPYTLAILSGNEEFVQDALQEFERIKEAIEDDLRLFTESMQNPNPIKVSKLPSSDDMDT